MPRRPSSRRVAAKYKDKKEVPKSDGKGTTTVYEYGPRQVVNRHKDKAVRIESLRKKMGDLRQKARGDLTASDPETRLTALAVCLMDETYERVGNEKSAEEGHFGVTNWTADHITLGDKAATIRYTGKSGVKQEKKVTNARVLSALRKAIKGKGKGDKVLCDGDECSILAKDVNAYLKPYGITAKDIRGLHANEEMKHHLKAQRKAGPADLPHLRKEKDEILKAEFQAALDLAAAAVGHEPSTLRSQYLVPSMEESYVHDGTVIDKLDKKASRTASWMKVKRFFPGVRNPVFHATTGPRAASIAMRGEGIKSNSGVSNFGAGNMGSISLSRDLNFLLKGGFGNVIFVLDRDELNRKFPVNPHAYPNWEDEYEERVFTDKIPPSMIRGVILRYKPLGFELDEWESKVGYPVAYIDGREWGSRTATLSDSEREDREDEAQVRQSPKLKPPRTDKERRLVKDRDNAEDDPDMKQDQKDRSRNFKDASARVALRYLLAQDGGGVSGKFIQFMEEEGDSEVKNPDTGNTVKLKSLKGDKGQRIQRQEFEKWLSKDKGSDEPSSSGSDGGGKDKEAPADKGTPLDEDTASAADAVAAARERRKELTSEDEELWDVGDIRDAVGEEFKAIPGLDSGKIEDILSKKVIVTPEGVYEPDTLQESLYDSVSSQMDGPVDTREVKSLLKSALSVDEGRVPEIESIRMAVGKVLADELGLDESVVRRIADSIGFTDPRRYVGGLVKEMTALDPKAITQFDKEVKDARQQVLDGVETLTGSSRQISDLPTSLLMGVAAKLEGSDEIIVDSLLDSKVRSSLEARVEAADKVLEKVSDEKATTPSAGDIAAALITKRTKVIADDPSMLNPTQPLSSLSLEPLKVPEGEEAAFREKMADRAVDSMWAYIDMDSSSRSKHRGQLESMLTKLEGEGHRDTEQYAAAQAQLRGLAVASALEDGDDAKGVNQTMQKALQFARKDGRLDDFVRLNITGASDGDESAQMLVRKAIQNVEAEDLKEMLPDDHPGHEFLDALNNDTYIATMDPESQEMLRELADDMILSEMIFTDMDLVKKGEDIKGQRKIRPPKERKTPAWKDLLDKLMGKGGGKSASLTVSRWDFAPWQESLSLSSR